MKTLPGNGKTSGFTLIELLVVIGVLTMLSMLVAFIPKNYEMECMSNQRQIALGFTMWKNDHGDKFPWQISTTNNGTMESSDWGYVAPNFMAIANNYVLGNRFVFICPTDKAKTAATNDAQLHNQNVSYFVGLDKGTNDVVTILTGDRHLQANGKPVKPGLFVYSKSLPMDWTFELHSTVKPGPAGVVSFVDARCEISRNHNLNSVFQRQSSTTNRLDVP